MNMQIQAVDFHCQQIPEHHRKGGKDLRTILPGNIAEKLRLHLQEVRRPQHQDLSEAYRWVCLLYAFACM